MGLAHAKAILRVADSLSIQHKRTIISTKCASLVHACTQQREAHATVCTPRIQNSSAHQANMFYRSSCHERADSFDSTPA
jgi:hypothetical protein